MSFLSEIKDFSKSQLKTTDTIITTPDGAQYKETRDKYGRPVRTLVAAGATLGYLADVKLDLQVGEVLPGLLVGSQDVAADLGLLQKHHVTHVLNVAYMVDNMFPRDFSYKHINILDQPETNILEYFPECFSFIETALGSEGCVFVHCNAGVSRAASIVIGYLMARKGMAFQVAYDHVKSQRPVIRPNDGFMKQLKDYNPE